MSHITWDPRAPCSLSLSQGQDPWFLKLLALLHLEEILGGCGGGGGGRAGEQDQPPSLAQPPAPLPAG